MKMIYLLFGLLIMGGLFIFLKNKARTANQSSQDTEQVNKTKIKDNKYEKLRNLTFTVTPDKLGITLPGDKTTVYGTVMDWDDNGTVVTVVSFQTGDASVYINSGQILIGGYAHETVRQSAINLVSGSQTYISGSEKTASTSLPDKDCVKFYFLTNKGTFFHQETVANITEPTNEWYQLFNMGQDVITQYRLITQDK